MTIKPEKIILEFGERIIAVVPERAAGPGWSNAPTWVYIETNEGRLREECIQPEERTPELNMLYGIGEIVCSLLISAIPTYKKTKP